MNTPSLQKAIPADSTFSQRLRRKIALVSTRSDGHTTLWSQPNFAEFYPELLFTGHSIIRASVPLMEDAIQVSRGLAGSDQLTQSLVEYLSQHVAEEMHHDEWLLEDLEVLGFASRRVLERIPSATVAALVGSQYYWIRHFHPVAVLGYIAVLEGSPLSEDEIEGAIRNSGLPRAAFRTLLKHAKLDPYHSEDLYRFLDDQSISATLESLIGSSAICTATLLDRAFEEVIPE